MITATTADIQPLMKKVFLKRKKRKKYSQKVIDGTRSRLTNKG
jgi:hypothetical protein